MKEFFLKIYDALSARRYMTAALLVILLCLCGVMVLRMHYEEDITAFLPTDQKSEKYSSVYNSLGGEDKIAVFFKMESDPDSDLIIEAMDRFQEILSESDSTGLVESSQITVDEASVYDVFDFIGENYPLFLQDEDFERIDSLLSSPDYIEEQIASDRRTLLLPSAGMMGDNIKYDPLGLFTPILLRLQDLDPTSGSTLVDEYLFTEDMSTGFGFVNSPFGTSESGMNSLLVDLLDDVADKTMGEFPDVKISSIGGPVIAVANSSRIKKDSILSVVIAMVLILLVLYLSFRRFKDIFWIAFSIFCGAALAMGMIALFKDSISIIVLGIGSIIIGIAVNYPLHYIDHLKHQPDPREALKEMVSPLVVGNVTTVSAFAALFLLKAKALHDFGLVGALVLVGTIVFSMVFLPVFVRKREPAKNTVRLDFDRHVTLTRGQRKAMFIFFVLITCVLGYFGSSTSFDSDMHHINYMTASQAEDLDLLSSLQGDDPTVDCIYGVSVSSDMETLLQKSEKMLSEVRNSAGVISVSSIGDFIPSKQRQEAVIAKWNELWQNHPDAIDRLNASAGQNGFKKGAFSIFTDSIEYGLEAQDADYFDPIREALGQTFILEGEDSQKKMVNYISVEADKASGLKEVWNASSTDEETSFFFDSSDVGNQLVSLLSDDFNYVGFLCGFIVFFFLWVSFGSLELSLLSFLPLAVSWLWILGIMNLTGIQFNIVNIILATFIFGQGDDYTIFITEGLMYEYAYHKKILSSYKNSVAMSAIIMFIGIGALIISKHPAMKSLAQVTIIGMFTVVLMAYYLPPLVFRWITTKKGEQREVPLTLGRIMRSLYALLFFLVWMLLITPGMLIYFTVGKKTDRKKDKFHVFLQKLTSYIINHIPGSKYEVKIAEGEDFSKPAVIICNHQSHLDIMALMSLTPKLVVLTKDWVWNNPYYGSIIRFAEFHPMSEGIEANLQNLKPLVERGYSVVVFPEGTRTANGNVGRFHRGAFLLAESLGIDILPTYIHGFYDTLPKKDFMLRKASLYLEVGKRVSAGDASMGEDFKERTRAFHHQYLDVYERIRDERETMQYWLPYVRSQYMYKGSDIMSEFRKQTASECLDRVEPVNDSNEVVLHDCGCGAYAMLYALSHRHMTVRAFDKDSDNVLLVNNCIGKPSNLIFEAE